MRTLGTLQNKSQRLSLILLAALSLLALSACQSTAEKWASVEKGMKKPEVLEIMGSPDRRQRWKGKDRWTYIYLDPKSNDEHEVHFEDGIAIYVGDRYRPEVSAEQQDASNEIANREVEARVLKQRADATRNLENYENEVRGTGESDYLPTFEPIQ